MRRRHLITLVLATATVATWFAIRPSNPTAKYFSEFETLKSNEEWHEIAQIGEETLDAQSLLPQDEAHIDAQLASTYFYLGDYSAAGQHARNCSDKAAASNEPRLVARGLYLLSAQSRALGDRATDPDFKAQYFEEAKELAHQAITLSDEIGDPCLLAKAYFNAGAAHGDAPGGDHVLAADFYAKAIALHHQLGQRDDLARTAIRLGKLLIIDQHLDDAAQLIAETEPLITRGRTQVHFLYLKAQLLQAQGKTPQSVQTALLALEQALELQMARDVERIQAWLNA